MYKPKLTVDIEITNYCNANCFMCSRRKIKEKGFISDETFRKVISRLQEYRKIKNLTFCGSGEPLLHPKIIKFVRYSREKGFNVTLVSNGSLLGEKINDMIGSGINNINISYSSDNKKTYDKIHTGLCQKEVEENIKEAIKLAKGKTRINLQVSPTKFNFSELSGFIRKWYDRGADFIFMFEGQHNEGGNLK